MGNRPAYSTYWIIPTHAFQAFVTTHGSLIFIKVLRIYNALYFIPLYHFSYLYIVLKDLNVTK
jgi:hypothetical protein